MRTPLADCTARLSCRTKGEAAGACTNSVLNGRAAWPRSWKPQAARKKALAARRMRGETGIRRMWGDPARSAGDRQCTFEPSNVRRDAARRAGVEGRG